MVIVYFYISKEYSKELNTVAHLKGNEQNAPRAFVKLPAIKKKSKWELSKP